MIRGIKQSLAFVLAFAVAHTAAWATPVPTLWGIDEDDGQLFSIGDYRNASATFTDFGRLMWDDNGRLRKVGHHLEAFTLDADGTAYLALNHKLGGLDEPVLFSVNLNNLVPGGTNIAAPLGRIGIHFDDSSDNITGLSFNPLTGDLYALFRDDNKCTADRLVVIDKADGSLVSDLGRITGLCNTVGDGEDLIFDPLGNLYVTDNRDDRLYQVDPVTAAIIAVIDGNEAGGLGHCSVKFEGLAWDPINDLLIGADDNHELLAQLTLQNGANISYGSTGPIGLTDVEGMAFIPEPATIWLMALWGLAVLRRRRR